MKNTKRSVSFILCITQIVICVLVMVSLSYELYYFDYTGDKGLWFNILMAIGGQDSQVAYTFGIIILAIFNISLVISALSLVFVIKWDSANSLAGFGIASIFLFNFGAGVAMVLGAHQLSSRYDSKKRLGSIFSVAQIIVAILVILLAFLALMSNGKTTDKKAFAFIGIAAVMLVSITMATLSLVSMTSCRNPRAMLAIGVLSIFLLNIGAGIMLISKAPEAEALLRAQAAK